MALDWLNNLPGLAGIYDITLGNAVKRGGDVDWVRGYSAPGGARNPVNSVVSTSLGNTPVTLLGKTAPKDDPYSPQYISPVKEIKTDTSDNNNDNNNNTGGGLQIDPAYQAFLGQQALDTAEAQRLREGILGRRGEIQDILNTILGNIDTELGEAKQRRTGQFDRDVDGLVSALDSAIPDIQNAFAAMGLSNSTYKGDRVQDTRDSYGKSWEDTNRQLNEDLTGFQRNANTKSTEARTNANKMFGALDEVGRMNADSNNLGQLKEFNSSTRNALTDFKGEGQKFTKGGDALRAISALDSDYDFGKTLDTFNAFASDKAAPSGNGVGGGKAKTGQIYEDDKKKNKTEVQINNPVGAASA